MCLSNSAHSWACALVRFSTRLEGHNRRFYFADYGGIITAKKTVLQFSRNMNDFLYQFEDRKGKATWINARSRPSILSFSPGAWNVFISRLFHGILKKAGLIRLYYTSPCSSILCGQSVLPDVNLGLVCFFLFRKENCNNLWTTVCDFFRPLECTPVVRRTENDLQGKANYSTVSVALR